MTGIIDSSSDPDGLMASDTSLDHTVGLARARSYGSVWRVALAVALLQALFAAGFILRSSFVIDGQRYFCLFDDAMISMRYAANWAAGDGLVWNRGERVEGYTNFGWTAILGGCHLPSLSKSHTCLLVQILGIGVLWLCLLATVLLARACRALPIVACSAVVLTGGYYNLLFFSLFGMETGLLVCLVTFALAAAVRSARARQAGLAPMLWFAPAMLVRHDVAPVMLLVFAYVLICARKGRGRLCLGLLVVLTVLAAHLVWRHYYYGQWLPNSYYLKLTGWPLAQRLAVGVKESASTAMALGLPFLLAIVAVLTRARRWHFLLLGTFLLTVAYQVYAGGDAWPLDRFVLPSVIGLLILAAEGIHRLMTVLLQRKTGRAGAAVRIAAVLLVLVAVNARHWDHCLLVVAPQTTGPNHSNVRCALAIQQISGPDAVVAVGFAGVVPYFSDRRCVDLLGKCDPHIAQLPAHSKVRRAGHNKFDYAYSLNAYKPDIVVQGWFFQTPGFLENYEGAVSEVDGQPVACWVRKDSRKVKAVRSVDWREAHRIIEGTLID